MPSPASVPDAVTLGGVGDASADRREWERLVEEIRTRGAGARRYRVVGEIGRGGMGVVRLAYDADLRRSVALKVMRPAGPAGGGALGRFLEEAQVTGQLDHPGIVPVHEVGVDSQDGVFFAMKLVRGEDLRAVFQKAAEGRDGWSVPRALSVVQRVCEAMSYAHDKGVIHRDLKPANVMVGRYGEAYVMDWGLARVLRSGSGGADPEVAAPSAGERDGDPRATAPGELLGTPCYMAPERVSGAAGSESKAADVYAVGAMLYQLVTGRAPYSDPLAHATALDVLGAVLAGPPEPARDLAPDAPEELLAILETAMARDKARRYASMDALASDLRAYLEGRVVRAYRTGAIAEIAKWIERNRALAAALLAAIAIAAALTVVIAWQQRGFALEQTRLAEAKNAERLRVLRLSDGRRLQQLAAEAERLWPARAAILPDLRSWLERARELERRLPEHEATLAGLEAQGRPVRQADGTAALAFADADVDWWHAAQSDLVDDLRRLCSGAEHGATIAALERRERLAERLACDSLDLHREAWDQALEQIADPAVCPAYGGLRLAPQVGLVPLGRDPASGLHEFADLQTGRAPERGLGGALRLDADCGVVFVLLPGATAEIGAQSGDPAAPRYDAQAEPDESDPEGRPVRARLAPFFLAKHELTQAQWLRLTGDNPSGYAAGSRTGDVEITASNPVDRVAWADAELVLGRLGFTLPTEAQWEYACRGGTESPWWTGPAPESLAGAANVADRHAGEHGGVGWSTETFLDDGHTVHAQIGTFAANPFGLHDMIGNVWEWCRDGYGLYGMPLRDGDGERAGGDPDARVVRGGSFTTTAKFSRSSFRYRFAPTLREERVGVRPARAVDS